MKYSLSCRDECILHDTNAFKVPFPFIKSTSACMLQKIRTKTNKNGVFIMFNY
jgi:hypothetical protein